MLEFVSPPVLALCAAVIFGATVLCARFSMNHVSPSNGAWLTILPTALLFWVFALATLSWQDFMSPWVFFFAAIGIAQPYISLQLSFQGTRRLGPTVSATVASTAPMFSLLLAMALLGEQPRLVHGVGTFAIVSGVVILSWQGGGTKDWAALAVLFPLGTAILRGLAQTGSKYGMEELPIPLLAALCSHTAAFLLGWLLRGFSWKALTREVSPGGWRWIGLTGSGNALAIWALYAALKEGEVIQVSPIVAAFPLFTMLFSRIFFRQEVFGVRVALGVLLIVPGVVAITVVG